MTKDEKKKIEEEICKEEETSLLRTIDVQHARLQREQNEKIKKKELGKDLKLVYNGVEMKK